MGVGVGWGWVSCVCVLGVSVCVWGLCVCLCGVCVDVCVMVATYLAIPPCGMFLRHTNTEKLVVS